MRVVSSAVTSYSVKLYQHTAARALLISEWKTDRKIMALATAKEGKGDIIIVTIWNRK